MAFNLFDFSQVKAPTGTSDATLNPFKASVSAPAVKTVAPFAPSVPELTGADVSAMDAELGITDAEIAQMDALVPEARITAPKEETFASKFKMESSESFAAPELAKDIGKFFINVPADSVEVVEQVGKAILNPIDTIAGALKAGQGLSDKAVF